MLEGRMVIDAHLHPARLPTVKPAWLDWAEQFGQPGWRGAYGDDGAVIPAALDDLPVVVHCGTSSFPGSVNAMADPLLLDPVLRDFPRLTIVLAHGGRGWWYDAAASLALLHDNVWIELSGLPPHRLASYYAR